jgi:nucleoside-diphosphate kinase
MTKTRTYAMIKPDAVAAKHIGAIINRIEKEGYEIVGLKKMHFSKSLGESFYAVHKERPFFQELVSFISSGPLVAMVLEKEDAITSWRDLMGATNPSAAAEKSLRKEFGTSIGNNAVHGSDAPETAATEIALIFPELA